MMVLKMLKALTTQAPSPPPQFLVGFVLLDL